MRRREPNGQYGNQGDWSKVKEEPRLNGKELNDIGVVCLMKALVRTARDDYKSAVQSVCYISKKYRQRTDDQERGRSKGTRSGVFLWAAI